MLSFLTGASISAVISMIFVLAAGFVANILAYWVMTGINSHLFEYMTNWITIPALGQIIVWGQGIAIVIVIAIRVWFGVSDGILRDKAKASEYLFKTIGAVVAIGLMPIAVDLIMMFIQTSITDVMTWLSTDVSLSDMETDIASALEGYDKDYDYGNLLNISTDLLRWVFLFVACGLIVSVYCTLAVRQFQMLVISVIAPWVGIRVATENSSSEYAEFLANLVGMGLVQLLQGAFLWLGVNNFLAWYSTMNEGTSVGYDTYEFLYSGVVCIAILAATKTIPQLLDRWTFSGGPSNAGVGRVMGYVVGSGSVLGRYGSGMATGGAKARANYKKALNPSKKRGS